MVGRWGGIPDVFATRVDHAAVDNGCGMRVALNKSERIEINLIYRIIFLRKIITNRMRDAGRILKCFHIFVFSL